MPRFLGLIAGCSSGSPWLRALSLTSACLQAQRDFPASALTIYEWVKRFRGGRASNEAAIGIIMKG